MNPTRKNLLFWNKQAFCQHLGKGVAAVGDGIFGVFIHFGKGPVRIGIRNEHRVVSEAAAAGRGICNISLTSSLE